MIRFSEETGTGNGGLRHQMLERMRSGLKAYLSTQSVVDRFNKLKKQRDTARADYPHITLSQHDTRVGTVAWLKEYTYGTHV